MDMSKIELLNSEFTGAFEAKNNNTIYMRSACLESKKFQKKVI
jgi:hypothetical protein